MKIAVMQPYFFPYVGYYQLISSVDKFSVLDDVNFIKRGWINRNRILLQGKPHLFTIPVVKSSQNKLICDTVIKKSNWQEKLIQTFKHAYCKAPYYNEVMPIISDIIHSSSYTIDALAFESMERIAHLLDIHTGFIRSTKLYNNRQLKGKKRIIDICHQEKATEYVNASGGRALYSPDEFLSEGISVSFVETLPHQYRQFGNRFHPYLSIIDVLMFCGSAETKKIVQKYKLVK